MQPQQLAIQDYNYHLPTERIALEPVQPKHNAKLLVAKNHTIRNDFFYNIHNVLEPSTLLVYNNSKVIPARLEFANDNGARIEIFLLEPIAPSDYVAALHSTSLSTIVWSCMVGGAKKWKQIILQRQLANNNESISCKIVGTSNGEYQIEFSLPANYSFAQALQELGSVPLPPYIKRAANAYDATTYQTVYAQQEGSVAAPTAGLHFTTEVMQALAKKNIASTALTLHVGAGTFKPVKAAAIGDHSMHHEYASVSLDTIEQLMASTHITAVGTTSCRTLESLYWIGAKVLNTALHFSEIRLEQWDVYEWLQEEQISRKLALENILSYLKKNNLDSISFYTQIIIAPGYEFKMIDCLITNFHQPQSTLLLLIAAFVGNDKLTWQNIYDHALQNDYRFLSYGDSSILYRNA